MHFIKSKILIFLMSENIIISLRYFIDNLTRYRVLDKKEYSLRILNESLHCLFVSTVVKKLKTLGDFSVPIVQ